jgi:hypothetical protein
MDRFSSRSLVRSAAVVGPVVLVVVGVAWPMLLANSGLGGDWEHHLWYVWQQSLAIRANHVPSMFLNTGYSVFYPLYAFYGGTIYALAGTLAVGLGNSPLAAYVLTYIVGFVAAYGGWYWMGSAFGLGRWLSHVPAVLFVTSACYLTLVYGQGDWPEFIALSMLPLMVAAGLWVVRAERLRVMPAFALAGSSVVFFGSHILTVLWASSLLGVTSVAILALVPDARRRIRRRGLIRLAALVLPALLVNAWFLLPMIAYASNTLIGSEYSIAYEDLHATMHLVAFHHLFTLSRASTIHEVPDYVLALPTLTIVWVLASIAILLTSVCRGPWLRLLAIFAAVTAGTIVLMTHAGLLLGLPQPYTLLQFSYRLEGYVLMGLTASVLAVLVLVRSGSTRLRRWVWSVVPVLILSVLGAIQQVSAYPHTPISLAYYGEAFSRLYDDYAYVPLRFVSEQGLPRLEIQPGEIHDNRASLSLRARPGQLVATNIGGGPNLLRITGASIVGADERSQLVLAIGTTASMGSVRPDTPLSIERISMGPAQSLPVALGRLLALAGAIMLAMVLFSLAVRGYRRR